jgi:hypothetical protein
MNSFYKNELTITYDGLLDYIKRLVEQKGSQTEVAKNLGISLGYLNDVLHKRKLPGTKLLKSLGCERKVIYKSKINTSQTK